MALSVYKKGQGTAARGLAGLTVALLGSWAAYQMWHEGVPPGWGYTARAIATTLTALVFGGVPLYLILFHHQVVDILIETQQEMRKVAWSTRQEVIGSTTVVLVTVAILAAFIFLTDQIVLAFFSLIRLLR
jgi:preprotein translocase SecE subunit